MYPYYNPSPAHLRGLIVPLRPMTPEELAEHEAGLALEDDEGELPANDVPLPSLPS